MYPHQNEPENDIWGAHRADYSDELLTTQQVYLFVWSIIIVAMVTNIGAMSNSLKFVDMIGVWLVFILVVFALFLFLMIMLKLREYSVWPETLVFYADGRISVDLGCYSRCLDASNGGVTLLKYNNSMCQTYGVWANAVTNPDTDVFVLVPTHGPRYWTGFVFQPEDPSCFIQDCRHAGVIMTFVDYEEELAFPLLSQAEPFVQPRDLSPEPIVVVEPERETRTPLSKPSGNSYEMTIDKKVFFNNSNIIEV